MRNILCNKIWAFVIVVAMFNACEFEEPFPDPAADFTIWGVNQETFIFEQLTEPYVLFTGVTYDFRVNGTGEQFVFWWGEQGDPNRPAPTGSNFGDRDINLYSSGTVARDKRATKTYRVVGEYTVVMVASSYRYSDDTYKEALTTKTVNVVAAN